MIPTVINPMGISLYGRRLQYIASTGTQYINTGVKPDFANGDSVEMNFYGATFSGAAPCAFGSRETGVKNGIYCLGLANSVIVCDNSGNSTFGFTTETQDITIIVDDSNITVNGESVQMPRRVTCGLPIFLFALNNYGMGTYGIYPGMRLYSWKYWHNGTLAQHLVPVLDRSGVPCMYDTVTRTLKYNAGTGTFNYE